MNRIRKADYNPRRFTVIQAPMTQNEIAEQTVVIRNREGLHMRPAMYFVESASGFQSSIQVMKDKKAVNGKSIMEMSTLAATQGTKLLIRAEGTDAREAVTKLAALLESVTNPG
jgi:phosphotransferase system HPr (HPr) family protein